MGNANDHVAAENSDDFPRVSNCAIYPRLWCPRCGCVRATDTSSMHGSLLRAITPRDCAAELFLLSRGTGHASRVSTTSSTEDELAMEEEQLACSRPVFSGRRDKKSLKRSCGPRTRGNTNLPPSGRHKGAHYTPVYLRRILAGVHLAGARGDSKHRRRCIWPWHSTFHDGDCFLRKARQLNDLRKDPT